MKRLSQTLIFAALLLCSCGNRQSSSTAGSSDSIASDSADVGSTIAMLPDTAYASVKAIRAVTEIIDTASSGVIDNTANLYDSTPGVFTFRGGAYRDAAFNGTVSGTPSEIVIDWEFKTENAPADEKQGSWGGGSGWTGQPLYVEWPDSCIALFRKASSLTPDFGQKEIIVGSLAGKVYFINYLTGKASRQAINVTNPIKGTISLDPTLNGNLYVGHGIPLQRPFGALVINLYKHTVSHTFGEDHKAPRRWGAYDSSPLRVGQFLFRPGENGTIYKFSIIPGSLKLHSTLHYTGSSRLGIESSMSAYANYGYTADNSGNLLCFNLNTMRPVWHYALGDDTDASPVIIVEDGHPFIYVGTEIDHQGSGFARFAKIDGLTGKAIWVTKFEGRLAEVAGKHFDGGFYSTALPGAGDCNDLIFVNAVRNLDGQNGDFVAIDRASGKVRYTTPLKYYSWSSPVGFLNEKSEQFVVTADGTGRIYIIRGTTGQILCTKHVGNNFESSPVVAGNSLVVGSRGNSIFKLSIK